MKRQKDERKLRLADFDRRLNSAQESAPDSIFTYPQHEWTSISVHPTADEEDVLHRLGMKPEECLKADYYWKANGDVYFLEVKSIGLVSNRIPGLYARWNLRSEPSMLYLLAAVPDAQITRTTVEQTMEHFSACDLKGPRFSKETVASGSYTPICAICAFTDLENIIKLEVHRALMAAIQGIQVKAQLFQVDSRYEAIEAK